MNNVERAKRFVELSRQLQARQLDRNDFVEFSDLSNKTEDYARSYLDAVQEVERVRGVLREVDDPTHCDAYAHDLIQKALEGANGND